MDAFSPSDDILISALVEAGTNSTESNFEDLVSALNEVFNVVCGMVFIVVFGFDSETNVETDVKT